MEETEESQSNGRTVNPILVFLLNLLVVTLFRMEKKYAV